MKFIWIDKQTQLLPRIDGYQLHGSAIDLNPLAVTVGLSRRHIRPDAILLTREDIQQAMRGQYETNVENLGVWLYDRMRALR